MGNKKFNMEDNIRIFGYGSLINEDSLRKTIPNARNIFPVVVEGFTRIFNHASPTRFDTERKIPVSVLNIEKSDHNSKINGICFDVPMDEFENLKKRESNYELESLEVRDYSNPEKKYNAYVFNTKSSQYYGYLSNSEEQDKYLSICLEGCKDISEEFLEEFKETTFIGDKTLKELEKTPYLENLNHN